MGAKSSAENIIDNSVSAMVTSVNTAVQSCAPAANISQVLRIAADPSCTDSRVEISNVDLEGVAHMSVDCAQQAAQSASSKTQIDQIAEQMAKAVTQALSLNLASAEASNIMRLSTNVAVAVRNNVSQSIESAAGVSQVIDLKACVVAVKFVKMSAFTESLARAVQGSTQVASAVTELKQAAKQSASAIQESLVGPFLIVVAVVVGAVLLTGGKLGGEVLRSPAVKYGLIPAAVAYLGYTIYEKQKAKK
jgi:hypothetical protein